MHKAFCAGAVLILCAPALGFARQTPPLPVGAQQPAAVSSLATGTAEGLIKLDVVVTDKSKNPVAGLKPSDFTLLDNGEPKKILSFRAFDGITARPDPPIEIILVIDTLNMPPDQIPLIKSEVERFLRRNNGRLAQPVSIFLLSDAGLSSMPLPSTDGNALADGIAHGVWQTPAFQVNKTSPENEQLFKTSGTGRSSPNLSLKSLGSIVLEARRRPGRKLLFWLSPGWTARDNSFDKATEFSTRLRFDNVTEFSTRLREARIALWSWPFPNRDFVYENFLAPVRPTDTTRSGNLLLDVLAVQSGGGRLGTTSNDPMEMIRECIEENSVFYTLTFDPPLTNEVDEYHALKVVVSKPDLTARTNTGYYNEPVYHDHPSEAKHITMEQLEQMLGAAHGKGDKQVAQELFSVELTERMNSTRLSSWKARMPGKESRSALVALADGSVLLPLPAADISSTAPPDLATRRLILSRTLDYLSKTILKLPNFFATRTTVQYDEPPQKDKQMWKTATSDQSLHVTNTSTTTVTFRNGKEVLGAETKKGKKLNARERELNTWGTFGAIQAMVFAGASAPRSELTWSHWEQGADGPQAVFRYAIPQDASHFESGFCCLADPDGTVFFRKKAAYSGEIAIDPASGAILRLTVSANLEPGLPMLSSAIMVEYGPVVIGEKTYICPTRSVSFSRQRTVGLVREWDQSFGVYGRFETILNDVTFGKYHMFRAESRMLPGYTTSPNER